MTRTAALIALSAALAIGGSSGAEAHRLDEYLQAARVSVSESAIAIELGLTPGVAVAPEVIARIDSDGDGIISPLEAGAYGRSLMTDVTARLDGAPLALTLRRVEVPTTGEMRDGEGTIRIELTGPVPAPGSNRHALELRNTHWPDRSVYLANAMIPATDDVRIISQDRDVRQQTYLLEYETRGSSRGAVWWLLIAAGGLFAHARWRLT